MRVLRVTQISTGRWCQWLQTGAPTDVPEAMVRANAARVFGIPEADLAVVETEWTWAEYEVAQAEMAAGAHEGRAVIAQPPPLPTPDPDADLLAALDAATTLRAVKEAIRARVLARRRG